MLSIFFCLIYCWTKLEIRAKQFLPGSEGIGGEREREGVRKRGEK
jgi:hypothetical protein